MHDLLINSPVLVYRKKNVRHLGKWKEAYNFLNIKGKGIITDLSHGPTKFKSTSIKPYFIDNQTPVPDSLEFI